MNKTDCIFCNIVKGNIPSYTVYEDRDFLGFLDIHPLNLGNSLLIPKTHYRWVYDIPNFGDYWNIAKKIALATQKAVSSHSVNFLTLGYEVPHAHIRIIPRFDNDGHTDGIRLSAVKNISNQEMEQTKKLIASALGTA
jgi:histidine triad (HIT) family protein